MPEDEQGFHHLLQEQGQGYQFQIDPPGKQIVQSVTDAYRYVLDVIFIIRIKGGQYITLQKNPNHLPN